MMALLSCRWQVVVLLLMAAVRPAWAGLDCAEPIVNAGEVRSGAPLRHVFHIVNRGTTPVEITDARSSCGCLTPKLDKRFVAAGEEALLPIEVNTLRQGDGQHTWTIHVRYLEAGRPGTLSVILTVRIISEVRIEPPALAVVTESGGTYTLTLTDRRPTPLQVTSLSSSSPQVRARVVEAAGPRTSLQVEVASDCPEGRQTALLRILTNDPNYPELEVPVTVDKRTPQQVRASPDAVELSGRFGEPLPSRIVLLSSGDGREVRIDQIETGDPAIECRWAAGPGSRATLRVRVDARRVADANFDSSVRVHLAGPQPQTVVIPVRCILK
jgi:hypothetical protein